VPVDRDGLVTPSRSRRRSDPTPLLVSIMFANNETGVLQPIAAIGARLPQARVLFHTDAVQAFGKIPLDVDAMQHRPAEHQRRTRSTAPRASARSTCAAQAARAPRPADPRRRSRARQPLGHAQRHRHRRLRLGGQAGARVDGQTRAPASSRCASTCAQRLHAAIPHATLNGSLAHRLPGILNISFAYVEGESLLMGLKDVAVSSGSACTSASLEPSYVLKALGLGDELAHSSLRISLGRFTTARRSTTSPT
jgi:cysteine desulfurase